MHVKRSAFKICHANPKPAIKSLDCHTNQERHTNINVTSKVTKDASLLSRWIAIDLYIREEDNMKFKLSMNRCSDKLASLTNEILLEESTLKVGVSYYPKPRNALQSTNYILSAHFFLLLLEMLKMNQMKTTSSPYCTCFY